MTGTKSGDTQSRHTQKETFERRLRMMSSMVRNLKVHDIYFYEQILENQAAQHGDIDGQRKLLLGSYNYLGLSHHDEVLKAVADSTNRFGAGAHGSRITLGTTASHRELERELSEWNGTEDTMVVSSGFAANIATMQALTQHGDTVFFDKLNHASLHDGCKLSAASLVEFSHDNLEDLDEKLSTSTDGMKFVVVDAVFSMDGNLLELPRLRSLCDKHSAVLIVDEAHSIGVLGEQGSGIASHFGMPADSIDVRVGVLSKALPGIGGFVSGSCQLIESLKATSHAFIFSGAVPAGMIEGSRASLRLLKNDPSLISKLHDNKKYFADRLRNEGFDLGRWRGGTPIIPVMCPSAKLACETARRCFQGGVLVVPAIYPAVAINAARLRTTVTAALTRADMNFAVDVLADSAKACGLLPNGGSN